MAHINQTHRLSDLEPGFLERYDLAGPRYTSYPTAPQWSARVGGAQVASHLLHTRAESAGPLSLYVHLPFCIERCSFCACNVIVSSKMTAVSQPYVQMLAREAELYTRFVDADRPLVQMHWGGGTPTYLNSQQLRELHGALTGRFSLSRRAEQSIEIHVNWTSDQQIQTLAELGFNRLSLGVQDFDPGVQEAIGRRQTYERTAQIIELARSVGFKGINCDLVYGLPGQSPRLFERTIEKIEQLRPDRLALYNFAYLPARLANQRALDPSALPTGEEKLQIFLMAHDRLVQAGYRYIGMDHFALPGDELAVAYDQGTMQRNFMGFTTAAGADLLGLGVSAIGCVGGMFMQNTKKLPPWEQALLAGRFPTERGLLLSADDLVRRDVIQAIMCRNRILFRDIEQAHGIEFTDYFASELVALAPMVHDQLLKVCADRLELSFLGRLFARNIAMIFDAYLRTPGGAKAQFSRTL